MYVCLPHLYLSQGRPLGMGPIRFYPSNTLDDFLSRDDQSEVQNYLETSPEVNRGTRVCVHPDIAEEDIPELLIDAVYTLYFSAAYERIFHNDKPPKLQPFTEFVPASESAAKDPSNVESLKALDLKKNQKLEITIENDLMMNALGEVLFSAYLSEKNLDQNQCRRIIRAIRYFIHCFHDKFRDLLGSEFLSDHRHFEPEEFLFLVTAFETLFDISPDNPNSDFKQKLRPVIHLKFGKPLETTWKWIDGFYRIKNEIVHKGNLPDVTFKENLNFEIPYISFATKLFIYSIYYDLYIMNLLPAHISEQHRPIAFHGIEREEVICFLWPEKELLKKISILMIQLAHGRIRDESITDVNMLAHIYQHMLRYYENSFKPITFIPTEKEEIDRLVEAIENLSEETFEYEGKRVAIFELMPEGFMELLERRVA